MNDSLLHNKVEDVLREAELPKSYPYTDRSREIILEGFKVELEDKCVIVYYNMAALDLVKRTEELVRCAEVLKTKLFKLTPGFTKDRKNLWCLKVEASEPKPVNELSDLIPGMRVEVAGDSWSGFSPTYVGYDKEQDRVIVELPGRSGPKRYRLKLEKIIRIIP